jgi:hypothetical protein
VDRPRGDILLIPNIPAREAIVHEAGIADRILDVVMERALAAGAPRITAIWLEAGVLAGVSEDSLRFHWEQHAAGTPAEGAILHLAQTEEMTDLRLVAIDVEDASGVDGEATGGRATDGGATAGADGETTAG